MIEFTRFWKEYISPVCTPTHDDTFEKVFDDEGPDSGCQIELEADELEGRVDDGHWEHVEEGGVGVEAVLAAGRANI